MKILKVLLVTTIMVMSFAMLGLSQEAFASPLSADAPSLGAAGSFSVLAHLSASSANMTTIAGDLGLSSGTESSITGPWDVGGDIYTTSASLAFDANASALGAYNNLAGQGSDGPLPTSSASPVPGVWTSSDSTTFSGTLTLDGTYEDVWVFQVPSDLTFTGSVVMGGDAQECNVFWAIGRDATVAINSDFIGTLIAHRDITVVSGANISGRIISLDSSITVDANTINMPGCDSRPVAATQDSTLTSQESTLAAQQGTLVPGVSGLPASGGAPLRNEILPLGLAVLFGGLSIVVSVLIVRALRRNYRQKQ